MKKKKVHLICNAHIDSIWQWGWQEGASSALSTFQSAANLLEDFDYVFNHNESVLYEDIEKYAPSLNKTMKEWHKKGKWEPMGGWFLQPDVLLPQGESIVRQIQNGKIYFLREYGKMPKTAVNFDSFGHSRGLVQIIKKCGQENYLFMRPFNWFVDPVKYQLPLPKEEFLWVGYDGSTLKATRCSAYSTPLGNAVTKIKDDVAHLSDYDVILSAWGVGNHGGGPSRKDLEDIKKMMEEEKDIEFIHSTPDSFFQEIDPKATFDKSLITCMPGCYTSMVGVKQLYRKLENELYSTEKLCSAASLSKCMDYPAKEFEEVERDMMNVEFHDLLCGTTVELGESQAEDYLHHGLRILDQAKSDAVFALIRGEKPAKEGTYPFFVYNPKPYEDEQYVDVEGSFLMPNDWDNSYTAIIDIYDENGNLLTSQTVKEEPNINMVWRRHVVFKAKLKPLGITRFTATYHPIKKTELLHRGPKDVHFDNGSMEVSISQKTGLIESFKVKGVEYAAGALFEPLVFEDTPDPWNMLSPYVGKNPEPMTLMKKTSGLFAGLSSFEVIEDGPLFIRAEAFFEKEHSMIRLGYTLYKKDGFIDVEADLLPADATKAFKLRLPLKGECFSGEQMFGYEALYEDGKECIAHDYVTLKEGEDSFLEVVTPSTYGCSYQNGAIDLTLLRTATYCAHPTYFGALLEDNIYTKKMDAKFTKFFFRLGLSDEKSLQKKAREFVEPTIGWNFFPTKEEPSSDPLVSISLTNQNIHLVTVKKSVQKDGYIFRLENNSSLEQETALKVGSSSISLSFGRYEVKTILYCEGKLLEEKEMLI